MVTYKPLWHTLIDKGMGKMELAHRTGMSNSTLNRLNKDKHVKLEVIERICIALDCPIEAVVKIKKDLDE